MRVIKVQVMMYVCDPVSVQVPFEMLVGPCFCKGQLCCDKVGGWVGYFSSHSNYHVQVQLFF